MKNNFRLKQHYNSLFANILLAFANNMFRESIDECAFFMWWFAMLENCDHNGTQVNTAYARHAGRQSTADERQRVEDDERERTRSGGLASAVLSRYNASGDVETSVTEYRSDYLGRMQHIIYVDGEVVRYGYDAGGQVKSVTGRNFGRDFSYVMNILYDEYGQRTRIDYGNGTHTEYKYDAARRWLDSIRTENKHGAVYQNIAYNFDVVGNVRSYTNDCLDSFSGNYRTAQKYEYDALYQLTRASGETSYNPYKSMNPEHVAKYVQEFAFDDAGLGNMTRKVSAENVSPSSVRLGDGLNYSFEYVYDENFAHRLKRAGNRWYKYDVNGNVIFEKDLPEGMTLEDDGNTVAMSRVQTIRENVYAIDEGWGLFSNDSASGNSSHASKKDGGRTYTWNERNQLIATVDDSRSTAYVYDYNGVRVNKYTARSETLYFNQFYAMRFDNLVGYGSGQAVKHIYLGDTRIVIKLNTVRSGTWSEEVKKQYFYHSDHLGSASLISDSDGKEYQRIEYTPYGETWVEKTQNTGMEYLPYKFTGKERDEETGLYYFGARYLDPQYSRWMSCDPAFSEFISGNSTSGGIYNHINLNLYHYSNNNPMKYSDPDGRDWVCRTVDGVQEVFHHTDITTNKQAQSKFGKSAYVMSDGQSFNGYSFYNGSSPYMTDASGNKIDSSMPIQGSDYDIFPGSASRTGVDPETLHNNWFGTSYTGPNNPTDYGNANGNNRNPNFDYQPRNKSEIGSIAHDKAYIEKGASGIKGALFNRDVVDADFALSGYNFRNMVTTEPIGIADRGRSLLTGLGFGLLGTVKSDPKPVPTH